MSLAYSFVSRDTTILAEYWAYSGNFASAALEWLERAHHPGPAFTVTADGRSFNFLLRGDYTFLVVADERSEQQMTSAFLELVATDFLATYDTRARSAPERALTRRFSPVLKAHMEFVMSHPDEESRKAALQSKVEEVKSVLVDNIERVLQESGRLDAVEVEVDTGELREETKSFSVWSRARHRESRCRGGKIWCILIALVIALLLLVGVALALCFVWDRCVV